MDEKDAFLNEKGKHVLPWHLLTSEIFIHNFLRILLSCKVDICKRHFFERNSCMGFGEYNLGDDFCAAFQKIVPAGSLQNNPCCFWPQRHELNAAATTNVLQTAVYEYISYTYF